MAPRSRGERASSHGFCFPVALVFTACETFDFLALSPLIDRFSWSNSKSNRHLQVSGDEQMMEFKKDRTGLSALRKREMKTHLSQTDSIHLQSMLKLIGHKYLTSTLGHSREG